MLPKRSINPVLSNTLPRGTAVVHTLYPAGAGALLAAPTPPSPCSHQIAHRLVGGIRDPDRRQFASAMFLGASRRSVLTRSPALVRISQGATTTPVMSVSAQQLVQPVPCSSLTDAVLSHLTQPTTGSYTTVGGGTRTSIILGWAKFAASATRSRRVRYRGYGRCLPH